MDYRFGSCFFDDERFALQRDGCDVPLRSKAVDLLLVLVSNPGRVIAKDDLLDKVWPDVTVGEDSLTQCIHEIRSAIGPENAELLRTIRGRGYMLDAKVALAREGADLLPTQYKRRRPAFILVATTALAIVSLAVVVGWLAIADRSSTSVDPIAEYGVLLTGSNILGEDFAYPEGKPEVAAAVITFQAGKRGDWHTNTSPMFVYVLEGEIEIEYENGRIFRVPSGRAFIEAIGQPHVARALGTKRARFIVVNIGVEGKAIREFSSAPYDAIARDPGADKCWRNQS